MPIPVSLRFFTSATFNPKHFTAQAATSRGEQQTRKQGYMHKPSYLALILAALILATGCSVPAARPASIPLAPIEAQTLDRFAQPAPSVIPCNRSENKVYLTETLTFGGYVAPQQGSMLVIGSNQEHRVLDIKEQSTLGCSWFKIVGLDWTVVPTGKDAHATLEYYDRAWLVRVAIDLTVFIHPEALRIAVSERKMPLLLNDSSRPFICDAETGKDPCVLEVELREWSRTAINAAAVPQTWDRPQAPIPVEALRDYSTFKPLVSLADLLSRSTHAPGNSNNAAGTAQKESDPQRAAEPATVSMADPLPVNVDAPKLLEHAGIKVLPLRVEDIRRIEFWSTDELGLPTTKAFPDRNLPFANGK